MPPRVARGTAVRGRGRGRGKAPASEDPDATTADVGSESSSQSTIGESSAPVPKSATPQHLLDETAVPSPNSSPVSIPTETPAPTPARAIVPMPRSEPPMVASSSSHSAGPSTRGGRGGARGAKPATVSRFKPKNVRSDASKLEEIRLKEQAKLEELAAEKRREEYKLARGRGRPARGRGDVMGRRGGTASGVFSIAPEALRSNPEFASKVPSGGGGSGGGGIGIKKELGGPSRLGGGGGGGGRGGIGADYNYEPRYPDQDDDAPRIDIETINISSDDDEPVTSAARPSTNGRSRAGRGGGLKPVRLHREEHKERITLVNTESDVKQAPKEDSDEEMPTIDELRSGQSAQAVKSGTLSPNLTFIKHEVDDDEGGMSVSFHTGKPPPSASPDAKRKLQGIDAAIPPIDLDASPEATAEAARKTKKSQKQRKINKHIDKKPVIQTAQDRAEYERHMEDVAILANELGGLQGNLRDNVKSDADGDVEMDEAAAEVEDKKSGRLYLFQFPPILPELYNPTHGKPNTPAEIQAEELANEEQRKIEEVAAAKPRGKGKAPAQEPLKTEEPILTPEERKRKEEEEKRTKRQGFVKEEGYIGKLIVRESGRVELSWGGTSLLIGRGVDAGFLTTGVIVDSQERGPPGGGPPEGKAMSMGQIMGKFVVTPDWQKMS